MKDQPPYVHLDESGIVRVGSSAIPLEEIVDSHRKGNSINAILARFPNLTREELHAALEYHLAAGSATVPRGPQQRDANWQRWNATTAEDNGTDTPPNQPIERGGASAPSV